MDGGVSEAMLVSALIGGGVSAARGGDTNDILKGALLGGATGWLGAPGGGNLLGNLGLAGAGGAAAPSIASAAGTTAAEAGTAATAAEAAAAQAAQSGGIGSLGQGVVGQVPLDTALASASSPAMQNAAMQAAQTQGTQAAQAAAAGSQPVSMASKAFDFAKAHPFATAGGALMAGRMLQDTGPRYGVPPVEAYQSKLRGLAPDYAAEPAPVPYYPTSRGYADGGIAQLGSRPNMDFMGGDAYPMSDIPRSYYATPTQMPTGAQQAMAGYEPRTNPLTGELTARMAAGGISTLARGRMVKGPGDGMSDSIGTSIDGQRPARLSDSEFVVPADVVSHLGNGSTDAGAKQLYAMMDRVRKARTGTKKQGRKINSSKMMPA